MSPKSVQVGMAEAAVEEPISPKDTERERITKIHAEPRDVLPPPQGPGRPLYQSASAPDLGTTIRTQHLGAQPKVDQTQVHADHTDYRKGLHKLLRGLDVQAKKRKAAFTRRVENEKADMEMHRSHQLFLESSRMDKQKSAWTYTDAPNFFELPQRYEQGESKTCSRNKLLTGIYDVDHPDFRPPHNECNVKYPTNAASTIHATGWRYFQTNLKNEYLEEFRDKTWQGTTGEGEWQGMPLYPKETMYKERLDKSKERIKQETHKDALDATNGSVKVQKLYATLGSHSCLKRGNKPWVEQRVSTHTTFNEYPPYKPGDHIYDCTLQPYIVESDRGRNYQRQIIVGDESHKSFWKCPSGALSGTNRRQVQAQELSFHNMRGATGLRPPSPSLKRKVLLKGTGSLSFTHFKDALLQPIERFSPGDRSEPP